MSDNDQYFMAVMVVRYRDEELLRWKHKTISSLVGKYSNFEKSMNHFELQFQRQDFELRAVTVFLADKDFQQDWIAIKEDPSISWTDKNRILLERRPDITTTDVFCADGFKIRDYRK